MKLLEIRKAEVMSIAMRKSTDYTNMAQLCYMLFLGSVVFRGNAGAQSIGGTHRTQVIFQRIVSFLKLQKCELDSQKTAC